jgi:hypothetical protein
MKYGMHRTVRVTLPAGRCFDSSTGILSNLASTSTDNEITIGLAPLFCLLIGSCVN